MSCGYGVVSDACTLTLSSLSTSLPPGSCSQSHGPTCNPKGFDTACTHILTIFTPQHHCIPQARAAKERERAEREKEAERARVQREKEVEERARAQAEAR
jgi:hypothetical protein